MALQNTEITYRLAVLNATKYTKATVRSPGYQLSPAANARNTSTNGMYTSHGKRPRGVRPTSHQYTGSRIAEHRNTAMNRMELYCTPTSSASASRSGRSV